jgi:3-hydroxybutyryl-CoA dehydrogenase
MPRANPVFHHPIGLIGLGLLGRGIATCLLAQGARVIAYSRSESTRRDSLSHIERALRELVRRKIVPAARVRGWRQRFKLIATLAELAPCRFLIESVKEDFALKRTIFEDLENVVTADTIMASNTSSIPISALQAGLEHPDRLVGMHWGEPAQLLRYLEIIPGRRTSKRTLQRTRRLAEVCGKEPTLLNEDIRGFLSNRMMYAMIREAFHLVEAGVADLETVDRSFRNDIGWWALLAGPFRWMDLTGIPAYALVMEGLLPELSTSKQVPALMRTMVASGAKGVANARGFYPYTKRSAKRWEKDWVEFTYDVRKLADKYAPAIGRSPAPGGGTPRGSIAGSSVPLVSGARQPAAALAATALPMKTSARGRLKRRR